MMIQTTQTDIGAYYEALGLTQQKWHTAGLERSLALRYRLFAQLQDSAICASKRAPLCVHASSRSEIIQAFAECSMHTTSKCPTQGG